MDTPATDVQGADIAAVEGGVEDPKASGTVGPESQPEQSATAKDKGPAPWSKDLTDRGLTDPNIDAYLREVWQPRVTKLEQQLSELSGYGDLFGGEIENAQAAASLLQALRENPQETYQELGELLGISAGEAHQLMEEGDDAPSEETPEQADPRLQWVDEMMRTQQEAAEDAEYEALLRAKAEEIENFNPDLFNHLVVSHQGDIDAATEAYAQFAQMMAPPEAPPTLGGGPGGVQPQEEQKPQSIRDALNDFMSEQKARRA